jgi:hypothetical protein
LTAGGALLLDIADLLSSPRHRVEVLSGGGFRGTVGHERREYTTARGEHGEQDQSAGGGQVEVGVAVGAEDGRPVDPVGPGEEGYQVYE